MVPGAVFRHAGRRRVSLQGHGPLPGSHLARPIAKRSRSSWPALDALGLKAGDRVAAMSDPCREFFIADMAAMCGGAICYGIYTTCSVGEVEYQLQNGEATYFLAEDQEFVDKALRRRAACRWCARSSCSIRARCSSTRDERLISFDEVIELGRDAARRPRHGRRSSSRAPTPSARTTSRCWSTRPAPPGRPRARCTIMPRSCGASPTPIWRRSRS